MTVVPATKDLLRKLLGDVVPLPTLRGDVFLDDAGEPILVGGLLRTGGVMILFLDAKPGVCRAYRKSVIKHARKWLGWAEEKGFEVYTTPDMAIDGSRRLIDFLGFLEVREGVFKK